MAFSLSLPKDKEGQQKLLFGLLPLLAVFVYYQFVHGKKVEEIEGLQARYEQLQAVNAAMRPQALTGGAELQQKLALYEQHMKRLEELIPQSEEVPQLLNSMSERAQDAMVDLALMRPGAGSAGQLLYGAVLSDRGNRRLSRSWALTSDDRLALREHHARGN